ncbi:MAG: hypothetical protein H0T46_25775 [Deltaproteobacteria bacterium]|nr:hypothetical protein [Deltaproteobacteria bacterium]
MLAETSRAPWPLAAAALLMFGAVPTHGRGAEARGPRVAIRIETSHARDRAAALFLTEDVWTEHAEPGSPLDVVVARSDLAQLNVPYRILVEDIDAAADAERARLADRRRVASGPTWFDDYRDVAEIDAFVDTLAAENASFVRAHSLGASHEGRPIHAIELSRGGPINIVLGGGHHAREWLSVMTPLCIADRIATGERDGDPRTRRILDAVTFVVAPLVNPDGYAYSWTTDRYWRKNRHGSGVDLNRNYSVAFGGAGSSGDPASPNYRGERAFSEPETRAVRTLFEGRVAAHVDFHAYSQVIVYPWSHQRADPPDRDKLAALADRMSSALVGTHGVRYAVRPGSTLTTGAGGTAGDWSYGERGALSFLIELRPASAREGGFVLPPDQIAPTCDEATAAMLSLAESLITDRARTVQ